MIQYIPNGDILKSDAQCLVVPVNTRGVMGKGLALQFKEAYPELETAYRNACRGGVFEREGIFFYKRPDSISKYIACLPTKRDWRFPSKMEWIEKGLYELVTRIPKHRICSLAIPAIGCGEGGLDWDNVKTLIDHFFEQSNLDVEVFLPY